MAANKEKKNLTHKTNKESLRLKYYYGPGLIIVNGEVVLTGRPLYFSKGGILLNPGEIEDESEDPEKLIFQRVENDSLPTRYTFPAHELPREEDWTWEESQHLKYSDRED